MFLTHISGSLLDLINFRSILALYGSFREIQDGRHLAVKRT